jgi:hypothetical protein
MGADTEAFESLLSAGNEAHIHNPHRPNGPIVLPVPVCARAVAVDAITSVPLLEVVKI